MSNAKASRKKTKHLKTKKKKRAEFIPYSFYLSAWEEDKYLVAQANVEMDKNGTLDPRTGERAPGRQLRAEAPQ